MNGPFKRYVPNLLGQILRLRFRGRQTFRDEAVDNLVNGPSGDVGVLGEGQSCLEAFLLGDGVAVHHKLFHEAEKLKKKAKPLSRGRLPTCHFV